MVAIGHERARQIASRRCAGPEKTPPASCDRCEQGGCTNTSLRLHCRMGVRKARTRPRTATSQEDVRMAKQLGNDDQYPWEVVAKIAEARILKVVIGWLLAVFTIVVTAVGYLEWRATSQIDDYFTAQVDTAQQRIDRYVDTQVDTQLDSIVLARLVANNVDSVVLAQIIETDVDSLATWLVEQPAVKRLASGSRAEPERGRVQTLRLDTPTDVDVDDSSDGTIVLEISVPDSAEYEISAEGQEEFDPVIAVMVATNDEEPELVDFDDDGGEGLNALLRVELTPDVSYELWVAGFLSDEPGTVTITFRRVEYDEPLSDSR